MKPNDDSDLTSGEGTILIEVRSKGAPITPEAVDRARRRAEALRQQAAGGSPADLQSGMRPKSHPDATS